ncbi:helix-turn-helix domain-containing protein [Streptomyces sp. NBC_01602]|uniref:helix-turn-helix domain-containing protein n=1 Tax=Streptomyces sp. NBC_01602 TaxID=2975893 RepID=UPI00386DF175|nr:helix-turn-helix domain-containing protein [Streptomyces sp. NBC_01602]
MCGGPVERAGSKWRARFVADPAGGPGGPARSGAPRKITDEQVEALVARTLDQRPPTGDAHWSTRSMAQAAGMSQSAVSRIWRAFGVRRSSDRAGDRRPGCGRALVRGTPGAGP